MLFKVSVEDIEWSHVDIDTSFTSQTTCAVPTSQLLECNAGRALPLRSLHDVAISPDRNVAAVLDGKGKLVVVDLAEDG